MPLTPISLDAARRLRPSGPYHMPPGASPIRSSVNLYVDGVNHPPEVILRDSRRNITWRTQMTPASEKPYGANGSVWETTITLPSQPTVLRYHFDLGDGIILQERRQEEGTNDPIFNKWIERDFQIGVYDPAGLPPAWSQGVVFYQIFPDRFARAKLVPFPSRRFTYGRESLFLEWGTPPEHPPRGRDFFGGDLRGLIERLDYLKDLGIGCIYLTPIFESPTNHRYDANDYMQIDSLFGTEEEFTELVEKVHARGLRIILDGVFNHCSSASKYFKAAQHDKASPYYRWFTFKKWPDEYEGWAGHGHMPEFVECPEIEEFFLGKDGVSTHWLKHGIDGWRTDVTPWVTEEFWRRFRRAVRAVNPEAYIVAEAWDDATPYFLGDSYDATMNYRFAWAVRGFFAEDQLSASALDDRLQTWLRDTPPPVQLVQMNLLDSHDTGRILSFCNGDHKRVKQMVAFQLAYVGAPMIYYGDEAGLEGTYAEIGRRAFPWNQIDQDFYSFYKRALSFRRDSKVLQTGSVETVLLDDARRLYIFARRYEGQSVYAAFNGGDQPATFAIRLQPGEAGRWTDQLGGGEIASIAESGGNFLAIQLPARSAAWYAR